MWLIGLCAMLGLALLLWKLTQLSRLAARNARAIEDVDAHLAAGRLAEALAAARRSDAPAARMFAAGLALRGAPLDRVMLAAGNVARIELSHARRGVDALGTLATVTALLGFLLSARGVQAALDAARVLPPQDPARVGAAFEGALLIAAGGIVVAILLFVTAEYVAARARAVELETSAASLRMVDALVAQDGAASAGTS